ncbi:hypothetical protein V8F06_005091 [Rhypophila decipiens]
MHLLKSLLLITPLAVSVMALATPDLADREAEAEMEPAMTLNLARDLGLADLSKRACKDNGCKCRKNFGGVWCAQCTKGGQYVVTDIGNGVNSLDHVYQCAKNGDCCDYGYATACKGGKAGRCGT